MCFLKWWSHTADCAAEKLKHASPRHTSMNVHKCRSEILVLWILEVMLAFSFLSISSVDWCTDPHDRVVGLQQICITPLRPGLYLITRSWSNIPTPTQHLALITHFKSKRLLILINCDISAGYGCLIELLDRLHYVLYSILHYIDMLFGKGIHGSQTFHLMPPAGFI